MATIAHCIFCFEVLAAELEKRQALELKQVEELWTRYERTLRQGPEGVEDEDLDGDLEMTEDEDQEPSADVDEQNEVMQPGRILRPRNVSRLRNQSPASGSASSTPSNLSAMSSQTAFSDTSKASSSSSFFSFARGSPAPREEKYPLFVTWDTIDSRGRKSLRGCIGTFQAEELSKGLQKYSLISAFEDTRFSPISRSEFRSLSNSITLLMAFTPCSDPLDWDLGTHGIRATFVYHGKRYSATYLPDVAVEQGWSKEETIVSLMRKAGWTGRSSEWKKVSNLRCERYQGKKASIGYPVWRDWRDWVDAGPKPGRR